MVSRTLRETGLIAVLYTLAHGLILLNKGVFWNDWCLYNLPSEMILGNFREMGLILTGYLHSFLLSFKSILIYRAVSFFCYLGSALFLRSILQTIQGIDVRSRIFIVLIFALFPVNGARVAMIITPSTVYYFMFFLGFWLVSKYQENRKVLIRISGLITLFISFFHNSLIFFFGIVFLYVLYTERKNIRSLRSCVNRSIRYADFMMLPIVFWAIKIIFLIPYGRYKGYNNVSFDGIICALKWTPVGFYTSFLEIIFSTFASVSFTAVICGFILTLFLIKQGLLDDHSGIRHATLLFVGLLLFFVGVFPYLAVHHLPQSYDWESRNQRLAPLGAALILYYALRILFDKLNLEEMLRVFLFSTIIFIFMEANIKNYIMFQKDWYKQVSLIENFQESKNMKDYTTFLFTDQTLDLNANKRRYGFYEYTGLMKLAFGDETRFGENRDEFEGFERHKEWLNSDGNMREYKEHNPEFNVIILHGDYSLDAGRVVRLMFREYFTVNEFHRNIRKIVRLNFIAIQTH